MALEKVAESLKKVREDHGLTQEAIAKVLGIDRSTYTFYENGKTSPSIASLIKLSELYDCTVGYLLGVEENHTVLKLREGAVAAPYINPIAGLSKDEKLLIMCFRLVSEEKRDDAIEAVRHYHEM